MTLKLSAGWLVAMVLATLGVCWLLVIDGLPLGVRGEWQWGRIQGEIFWPGVLMVALVLAAYAGFIKACAPWVQRDPRWLRSLALAALVPASFGVQIALQQTGHDPASLAKWPLVLYFAGPSGYYTAARSEVRSAREFLLHYPDFQARHGPFHLGTHPPGLVLLHYGAIRLCESSPRLTRGLLQLQPRSVRDGFRAVTQDATLSGADQASLWLIGLLTQLASAATVVPLFLLTRRVSTPAAAWTATALWPLIPAVTLFMPKSDVLYPLFTSSCLAAAGSGRSPLARYLCHALAGVFLCLGMFLSFALVALIPVISMVLVFADQLPRAKDWGGAARRLSALAVGFLAPVLLLWLGTGHNLPVTWLECYRKHAAFYSVETRSYWDWVGFNLGEFFVALGVPLATAALVGTILLLKWGGHPETQHPGPGQRSDDSVVRRFRARVLVWSWLLTLLVLNFSGKNLGEVARLWIFWMPLAVPAAAQVLMRSGGRWWPALVLLLMQSFQTVVLVNHLQGFYDPRSVSVAGAMRTAEPERDTNDWRRFQLAGAIAGSRFAGIRIQGDQLDVIDPQLADIGAHDAKIQGHGGSIRERLEYVFELLPAAMREQLLVQTTVETVPGVGRVLVFHNAHVTRSLRAQGDQIPEAQPKPGSITDRHVVEPEVLVARDVRGQVEAIGTGPEMPLV
jgi:hypothetical protein